MYRKGGGAAHWPQICGGGGLERGKEGSNGRQADSVLNAKPLPPTPPHTPRPGPQVTRGPLSQAEEENRLSNF